MAKPRLNEVTLMRTILAVLIVLHHAFACYNGLWPEPAGYRCLPLYKWIDRVVFAFPLEAFVFVSGYLFAFQRITLNRANGGLALVISKLKRLILPSILFSLIYFALFNEYHGLHSMVYSVARGCGHMWFLPMLFWCFIVCWLFECVRIADVWKLLFFVLLNLLMVYYLPLRLDRMAVYMVYFFGGFICYKHSGSIKAAATGKRIIWCWALFAVLFVVFRPLRDIMKYDVLKRLCTLLYASAGTLALYISALWYMSRHALSATTENLSLCCFGIYLFQQFILWALYYKTGFPQFVGPYLLPWLGFAIALPLSWLLTTLFRRTKTGKFLIG